MPLGMSLSEEKQTEGKRKLNGKEREKGVEEQVMWRNGDGVQASTTT